MEYINLYRLLKGNITKGFWVFKSTLPITQPPPSFTLMRKHCRRLRRSSYLFPRQVVGGQQTSNEPNVHLKHGDFCILQREQRQEMWGEEHSQLPMNTNASSHNLWRRKTQTQYRNAPGLLFPLGEDYIEGGLSTLQRDFLKQETVNSGNIRFWAGLEPRPATDNWVCH